jgi:iron complex outermembrane recepter protein
MTKPNESSNARRLFAAGLAGCSAAALCAALTAVPAMAQSAGAAPAGGQDQLEEIIVTGIRGSLLASAEIKRNAGGILDSIASEDLGKFPDSNVAESLQRIPGVSIDRNGGEGQFITVRGFGPEFNTVLVNGRTFASDNQGREFSFDLLAAELINGADIYKSSQAHLQDGGIGSTVNVKTPRPLEIGGFKAIASAKGLYEDNNNKTSPQAFGLISGTSEDETLGALLAVSYQKRDTLTRFTNNRGYLPGTTVGPQGAPLFTNVFAPRNQDVGIENQERERLGVNLTTQWKPQENLTVTFDGLYNRYQVDSLVNSLGSWFEPGLYTAATIDGNRTVTSLTNAGFGDLIVDSNNRDTTTRAAGINFDWEVNDSLTVKFDSSYSKAKNDAGGKDFFTVIGIPSNYSFREAVGGGFPSVVNYTADLTNPRTGRTHIALREGNDEAERVFENKFDTEWKADSDTLKVVRFGLINTDRKKTSQLVQSDPNTLCLYCGYATLADSSLLRPFDLGSFLGNSGSVPTRFQTYDANAYFRFLESRAAADALDQARGNPVGQTFAQIQRTNGFAATVQPSSFAVEEKVYAGYIDADFEGELGAMPWFVNVGARYVHTEVTSSGRQLQLTDLLPVPGDATIYNAVFANGGVPQATKQDSSYDYLLPSLNVRVNVSDDVIARFGASRTLTRPQLVDLAPRLNFDVNRPASLSASGGNPNLKPYISDNFDLSFEWYPTRTTTLSAAAFYKHVRDFIVQTRQNEVFTIANAGRLSPGFGGITGPNEATYSVRRPRNADVADVHGFELNIVHTMDYLPGALSGFGFQANATFVDSNATFDPKATTVSFALEGLGDSQNLTVFYEYEGFGARVAYNRRERFLEFLVTPGQGGDPVFRRTFDQWDARVSYDVFENVQVFAEGINILGNENITTGRFDNQVLSFIETGARYSFGIRTEF